MRILITGATGLIGKSLCQRLAEEGHEIVVLSRRPKAAELVPGAKTFRWEAEEGAPGPEVWEGVEAVVHLAGEPVAASRWTAGQKKRIRESRVTGTRNLVGGIEKLSSRPKVFVSGSAVGFYGNRGDDVLTETSDPGEGFLVDVCLDWESEATRARDLGLRVALVRTGVVLSAEGGALEKMLPPFKLGLGGRLGGGRQWFPWIHLDDIAGVVRHALLTPAVTGPINGAAPGIVTNEVFTKELAAALHRPVFLPVPELALRIAMGEMAEVVMASQRVSPKVAEETGYRFRYPQLREALAEILSSEA